MSTAYVWCTVVVKHCGARVYLHAMTREAYLTRLRAACAHVNENFDVAGLNRELPGRVQQLLELKGDKLRK